MALGQDVLLVRMPQCSVQTHLLLLMIGSFRQLKGVEERRKGGEGKGGEERGREGRRGEGRGGKIVPCGPIALQVTYVHTKANIYTDTHKHQCATHTCAHNVAYFKNLVKRLHVSLPHCQLVHHSPQVSQHRRRVVLLTRRTVGLKHLLSLPQGVLVAIVTVCGQYESPQHGVQRLLIWFWLPT